MEIPQKILEGCIKGERKAQFEFYHLKFKFMMRIAYRYFPREDEAASIVNEGFLKVFTKLEHYNNSLSLDGWLAKIMFNTIIDNYRKNKKNKETIQLIEQYNILKNEQLFIDAEILEQMSLESIEKYLQSLNQEERLVFNLFEIEGYSHKEIAHDLNVTERSSKRYLSAAKEKLRKLITASTRLTAILL